MVEWTPPGAGEREPGANYRAIFARGEQTVIGFFREARLPASHRPVPSRELGNAFPFPRDFFLGAQFLLMGVLGDLAVPARTAAVHSRRL